MSSVDDNEDDPAQVVVVGVTLAVETASVIVASFTVTVPKNVLLFNVFRVIRSMAPASKVVELVTMVVPSIVISSRVSTSETNPRAYSR